jgi:hypothetical protein
VPADAELPGLVADDHRVPEQAMGVDAAPERALGGELDRIGGHRQPCEAGRLQVRPPRRFVGEALGRRPLEPVDDGAGEVVRPHVGQGRRVDDVVAVIGPQQREEVAPALGPAGGEERAAVVAELRGHAVPGAVSGTGVVDRDPAGRRQPGAEHRLGLGDERVVAVVQQAQHLALRDHQPEFAQEPRQALGGDLALMVLEQHEAPQPRPEVAGDPGRQRRDQRAPVGRLPALAPVADHPGRQR